MIELTWMQIAPGLWRSLDGRYAIVAVTLPERPPRTVYQVRKIDLAMAAAYPQCGDLGYLLEESPWLWNHANHVHSAQAIAERDAYGDAHAAERHVPDELPGSSAVATFYWPVSRGGTRAGLAIVEDGDRVVARVIGMSREDDGFVPGTYAEIDLTPLRTGGTPASPGPACSDCAVAVGQPHDDNCDVARCLATGRQRLMCEAFERRHVSSVGDEDTGQIVYSHGDQHDCGHDAWTGRWPGEAECEEYGWYVQDRMAEGLGWLPCGPAAPGAVPDLNRLHSDGVWNAETHRFDRQPTPDDQDGAR